MQTGCPQRIRVEKAPFSFSGRTDGRTISHGEKPMPYPRKRVWIVGGIILAACVVLAGAGVAYTSGTEFCLSCHEMRVYQDELRLSSHAKDAQGKDISCSQCHIPSVNLARMLGAKACWDSRTSGCTTWTVARIWTGPECSPWPGALRTTPIAAPVIRI